MPTPINDVSTPYLTTPEATVDVNGRRETVRSCVVGRDAWAYQMARVELQNQTLARLRAARTANAVAVQR